MWSQKCTPTGFIAPLITQLESSDVPHLQRSKSSDVDNLSGWTFLRHASVASGDGAKRTVPRSRCRNASSLDTRKARPLTSQGVFVLRATERRMRPSAITQACQLYDIRGTAPPSCAKKQTVKASTATKNCLSYGRGWRVTTQFMSRKNDNHTHIFSLIKSHENRSDRRLIGKEKVTKKLP